MGKRNEINEIKDSRNGVIRVAEQYRRPPAEENPAHRGPLCFLPGLFTSSIVVSGKSRKRWHGFKAFVEERILENDEEVLSFFDADKNMEAFRKVTISGIELSKLCLCDTSFGHPPALLLAKARKVQERCFLEYVEEMDTQRYQDVQSSSKYELSRKEAAYQNWLFSLAFYEIFVLDYYGSLVHGEMADDLQSVEEWGVKPNQLLSRMHTVSEVDGCGYDETGRRLCEELDRLKKDTSKLLETTYHTLFLLFLADHIFSLFAAFGSLILIEFCNIGCAENGGAEGFKSRNELYRKVRKKAASLEKGMLEWDMGDADQEEMEPYLRNLFTVFENKGRKERDKEFWLSNIIMPPEKWLRGYESSVNNVLNIAFALHPSFWEEEDEPSEEDVYLFANLSAYIHILRHQIELGSTDWESEKKLGEIMDNVRIYLAMPIWEYLNSVKIEED